MLLAPVQKNINQRHHQVPINVGLAWLNQQNLVPLERQFAVRAKIVLLPIKGDIPCPSIGAEPRLWKSSHF